MHTLEESLNKFGCHLKPKFSSSAFNTMRLLRLCNAVRDSRMLYVYVKELLYHKKSLKYQSEAVNRRSTDNTMTKRKQIQKDKQRSTKHYTEN
jgi:hypothetical protein